MTKPGEPKGPEKLQGSEVPKTVEKKNYDETLFLNESAESRDKRTVELLSELSTIPAKEFVKEACIASGIEPPKPNDKLLAPKVIAIQRKLGFPEDDNPMGIDGKLGNYTFKKLLVRFAQLKQFDKRRQEIVESTKQIKDGLIAGQGQPLATASAPNAQPPAKPAESKDRTPISANEVALVGDSLTFGYQGYFRIKGEKVPTGTNLKYVRIGKSALTMLKDFNKLNNQGKFDHIKAIVLFGGANDLEYRSSQEIVGYLEAMKQVMLAKNPPAKVVLVTLPPVKGHLFLRNTREVCEQRVKEINAWIRQQAGPNVEVVDLYNMIADPNKDGHMAREYNGGDGLHLSGKAYKNLAEAVQKAVV